MKVQELIEKLQSFDPDATVVIDDADTSWLLNVTAVGHGLEDDPRIVVIEGDYHDRYEVPE